MLFTKRVRGERFIGETTRKPVTPAGAASVRGLPPGAYDLQVRDSRDGTWWSDTVEMMGEMSPLFIEIDFVRVCGSVSRGGTPVRGTLVFGTRSRRPSIAFDLDEDGRFDGHLPFTGEWALELEQDNRRQFLEAVTVQPRRGKSHAEVDVRLPDTLVTGMVVEEGRSVPGARVVILRRGDRLEKEMFSSADDEGRFRFVGLRTGEIQLRATKGPLASAWVFLDLEDGDEHKDLELKLVPDTVIEGRVVAAGRGVPGVRLVGFPVAAGRPLLAVSGATRADGSFEMRLPKGLQKLDLAIVAPGYEVILLAVQLAAGEPAPLSINLQGTRGNVLLITDDLSYSGWVSFGNAIVPMRDFRTLMSQERRTGGPRYGHSALEGLAAGPWTFCREDLPDRCVTEELLAGEDVMVDLRREHLE